MIPTYVEYSIVAGGLLQSIDLDALVDEYYIKSVGTITLTGPVSIIPDAGDTPINGEVTKFRWGSPCILNGNTIDVYGRELTQKESLSKLIIECRYNGASWDVYVSPDTKAALADEVKRNTWDGTGDTVDLVPGIDARTQVYITAVPVAAIASYALVAFGTESEELEASFKYSIMGSVASSFILLGIGLLYSYTSSLNMADICVVLAAKGHSNIVSFISVLFLMGFGLKAAIVPFHAWLPDAHPSAPAPISAMLSGVFIKTLGVYALCRVFFNVIGISAALSFLLVILGIISMSIGAFLAIGQSDIKRMLAYSSISQIGYIIFAIGIGTPLAILGGLFHLANHAIFKSLLFLNSGAVEYSIKTRDLGQMGGLNRRLPVTGYTSLVASMSISGIPPLSGFWSKLIIIVAAIQAKYFGSAIIAVLISILTLAYYLKLQRYAFFGELNKKWEKIKEVPWSMKLAMVTLSIICLLAGVIYLPELSRIFLEPAVSVMLAGKEYAGIVLGAMK